jgi:hypothetical protein
LDAVRARYRAAKPFPFFCIDDFLEDAFAREVAAAYPSYLAARGVGFEFDAVNERLKVQVTDSSKFSPPVKRLADALSSESFLRDVSYITDIPRLVADPAFSGGGMHLTGPGGRLDVHVDFNYLEESKLHRRLNILVYLNPVWEDAWGGDLELWDEGMKKCWHVLKPQFNRCVVFETSEISFHGVRPVTSPPSIVRQSFAAYYYTKEAPAGWDGTHHSTIFRARPNERLRKYVLMPAETLHRQIRERLRDAKRIVKNTIQK